MTTTACAQGIAKIVMILMSVAILGLSESLAQGPTTELTEANTPFRECPECPEMIAIPPGSFLMGSVFDAPNYSDDDDEQPQLSVTISAFAAGRYEVSNAEWQACVAAGACAVLHERPSQTASRFPVTSVSWNEAREYTAWLSALTGHHYRLLSEAEWEYAARAGTTSLYWWGNSPDQAHSSYYDYAKEMQLGPEITEVGSFPASPYQMFDTAGNVLEWVQDCYTESLANVPTDGSAFESQDCAERSVRGGWGHSGPLGLRPSSRRGQPPGLSANLAVGFRVARDID